MQMTIIFVGAYLAIQGDITAGTVIIFINLSGYLLNTINIVPKYWAARKAVLLRLEAFDDGEAAEEILDLGHEALVPVADGLLPLRQRAARHRRHGHRQQPQRNSQDRQQRAVPDHHSQGPRSIRPWPSGGCRRRASAPSPRKTPGGTYPP